jgi:hypothetical protein
VAEAHVPLGLGERPGQTMDAYPDRPFVLMRITPLAPRLP